MTDSRTAALARLNEAYFSASPHEQKVIKNLRKIAGRARLAIDAGASLGQYTKALLEIVDGEVISIEADPMRVDELRRNADAWATVSSGSAIVRHAALTATPGPVTFYVTNSDISGGLTANPAAVGAEWEAITVDGTTLDDVSDDVPDFVKIDVEGAEGQVVAGAKRILAARKTVFLVELHSAEAAREVKTVMRDNGYRRAPFYGQSVFTPSVRQWVVLMILSWPQEFGGRVLRRIRRTLHR
jgi:FkbM family methyltransferase